MATLKALVRTKRCANRLEEIKAMLPQVTTLIETIVALSIDDIAVRITESPGPSFYLGSINNLQIDALTDHDMDIILTHIRTTICNKGILCSVSQTTTGTTNTPEVYDIRFLCHALI